MPLIWALLESYNPLLQPQVLNLHLAASCHHPPPPHTALRLTPVEPTHPSTPPSPHTAGPIQPSTPPLPPPPTAPSLASVVGSGQVKPKSALAVQDGGVHFTVVNRKKMRNGTTERHESKQKALRVMGVNIDCRWAPTDIAKIFVSLPKQGVPITTISQRTQELMVSRSYRE